MKKGMGLIFVFIILSAVIISADYDIGDNYLIEKAYGPGGTLKGWIEIGFDDEPSDSLFESSVEGQDLITTATLLKLLEGDETFLHICSPNPSSCVSNYEATVEATSKSFTLDAEESALFGFKFSGDEVTDFSIDVESTAGESNSPQLLIDVLNNGENIWQAHTASVNFRDKKYGCYRDTISNQKAKITTTQYCQKIKIPLAPKIKIGAVLIGSGDADFVMSVELIDRSEYGECVPVTAFESGEISCVAKYLDTDKDFIVSKEQDYFVCIKADSSDDAEYEINSETNNFCGFAGTFNNVYTRDFEIFVEPGKYGAMGTVTLDDTEIISIESYIVDYLSDTYNNDCPSTGCIVPIKITSMIDNQPMVLSNVVITYLAEGVDLTTRNLYNLTEIPATISADMQNLSIDAGNFAVPNDYEDYTISLSFKGVEIFSEEITVEKIPTIVSVDPRTTAASYPTDFTVTVDSDKQIKLYEWDFGNGDEDITTTNTVKHTYNTRGTYNLKVTIIDIDERSSTNSFTITVGSASVVTGRLLLEKKTNLETVQNQIKNFSAFEQEILEEILNIDTIGTDLGVAETANANANTERDFQAILQDLMSMELPQMIFLSSAANSIIFYPKKTNINIDVLTDIAGGSYESSKEDKYVSAVLGWSVRNVDITLTHREITSSFENYNEPLLNTFEVEITKKAGSEDDPYIILKQVEGLTFAADYSKQEKSGYFYFPLVEESKKIIFATTEDINFIDLPLFVSPEINKLSVIDFDLSPLDASGNLKKWVLFSLIMLLLIIIGVIFWVVLHTWYKKKYENYLFKNKNNLYNLFTWIGNAKKRGLDERGIKTQLRKAGWASEQTTYALKKYSGKKTGMPGISLAETLKKIREKKTIPQGKFPGNLQKKLD